MIDEQYPDDPSIPDDTKLWRRIDPVHIADEETPRRLSYGAFRDSSDGTPMSVTHGFRGRDPRSILTDAANQGVVEFTAGHARAQGQRILAYPVPEDEHHLYVAGPKSQGKRKAICRGCQWAHRPESWADVVIV